MTSGDVLADIKAIVAAATARPAYTHSEAKKDAPAGDHTIVYLSRRFGGNVRGDTRENNQRLLQLRNVSKSEANVRLLEDKVAAGFDHVTHDVSGTPVHFAFETQDADIESDADGFYSRLTDYTFTL